MLPDTIALVIQQATQPATSSTYSSLIWYLPIILAYLILILYVSRAKKVREELVAGSKETSTRTVDRSPVLAAEEVKPRGTTADLVANINTVHVQQFLANIISVIEALGTLRDRIKKIPELNSAFPRRSQRAVLDEIDLEVAIRHATRHTSLTREEIDLYIQRNREAFLRTQGLMMAPGGGDYEKVDVRKVIDQIEKEHKDFNGFRILHEADLISIFKKEGPEVFSLEKLEVLAAIIRYDHNGDSRYGLLLKEGDVHQALKEFSLAHEIGHWFAHIKNEQAQNIPYIDFYLHSFHDLGPFENEANKIAMIALFPTPYLSWCDVFGNLNDDYLLSEFLKTGNMPDVSPKFATYMKAYIRKRIEGYNRYRQLQLQQLRLSDRPIKEATIKLLLEDVLANVSWARLNDDFVVIDANKEYANMFGLSREELLNSRYRLVEDLTDNSLQEMTKKQLSLKRETLKPKFYFTRYKNPKTQEVFPVTIYSFPIIDEHGKYTGSFGVVTDMH